MRLGWLLAALDRTNGATRRYGQASSMIMSSKLADHIEVKWVLIVNDTPTAVDNTLSIACEDLAVSKTWWLYQVVTWSV